MTPLPTPPIHASPTKTRDYLHLNPTRITQFQLAQQQTLLPQVQQQQQQWPIRTTSSAFFAPSLLNPTSAPPSSCSNTPFSRSYNASSSNAPLPLPGPCLVAPATLRLRFTPMGTPLSILPTLQPTTTSISWPHSVLALTVLRASLIHSPWQVSLAIPSHG